MSEYQYYEFEAIDGPLTRDEQSALRAISSRATITATRLANEYSFGNFRGDPHELMERYFDIHVYVANWGTRQLMLRLPRAVLDPGAIAPYEVENYVESSNTETHVILDIVAQEEEPEWVEDADAWLQALREVRAELADGDLRCLYLAWLSFAQRSLRDTDDGSGAAGDAEYGNEPDEDDERWDEAPDNGWDDEPDPDTVEPPVPPGLATLSEPLQSLAQFLRLDPDLLAVAAQRSPAHRPSGPRPDDLRRWVGALPETEKTDLLVGLLTGSGPAVRADLLRRFRAVTPAADPTRSAAPGQRTVRELLAAAVAERTTRRQAEAERQARERAAYLDTLAPREAEIWRQIEDLIEQRQAAPYAEAVRLLSDLRDLAAHQGTAPAFTFRLAELRTRHARRAAFIARLDKAGLRGF